MHLNHQFFLLSPFPDHCLIVLFFTIFKYEKTTDPAAWRTEWHTAIEVDGKRMFHYENLPMQYTKIFKVVKDENFQYKNFDIVLIFAQNIDCRYTLEPPRRTASPRRF